MNEGTAGLILHVDDERSVRTSMSILLHADGYGVDSAASGAEALQLVSGGLRPDVLIGGTQSWPADERSRSR